MTFLLERFSKPAIQRCPDCDGRRTFLGGGLIEDETAVGMYSVHLYLHHGEREAFVTVSFGNHGVDSDPDGAEPVTFAARFGEIEGVEGPAFSAVDAREFSPPTELYGRRLDRDEALGHPSIEEFWGVCDVVAEELLSDPQNWPDGIGVPGRIRSRARHFLHHRG